MKANDEEKINDLKKSIEEGTADPKVYSQLMNIYSRQLNKYKNGGDSAEIKELSKQVKDLYTKAMEHAGHKPLPL